MRSFILKSCLDVSSHTDLITKLAQITDEDSAAVQGEEDISLLILLCSHIFHSVHALHLPPCRRAVRSLTSHFSMLLVFSSFWVFFPTLIWSFLCQTRLQERERSQTAAQKSKNCLSVYVSLCAPLCSLVSCFLYPFLFCSR